MHLHRGLAGALTAAAALLASRADAQCPATRSRYSILDIGTLGGSRSYATALDSAGRVVGGADLASGLPHPVLWEDGVLTDLGTFEGPTGSAFGINGAGKIAGQADDAQGRRRPFLWSTGGLTELLTLGRGPDGRAFDINDAGVVVGISNPGSGYQHAVRWQDDTIEDLGALSGHDVSYAAAVNESGQIAGWSGPGNSVFQARAWLLDNQVRTALGTLGGTRSVAAGLDDTGRVVGWSDVAGDASYHGFVWDHGVISDVGTLGGDFSAAAGADASGVVVGWAHTPEGVQHAFVFDAGEIVDLNDLIPPDAGIEPYSAAAVNDSGQIVGSAWVGGQRRGFLATPAGASIEHLIGDVEDLDLPRGTANSLIVKLRHARSALDGCAAGPACTRLQAFANEVRAQAGKKLSEEQAATLLTAVQEIVATLGC